MAKKFNAKKGDTYLFLRLNTDLTGSTVRVIARPLGASTPLPDLTASIIDAPNGDIRVTTGPLAAGVYELEVEQNQAGIIAHYPNKGYDMLIIGEDLDA